MCLGIVGRVVALRSDQPDLADVDVAGMVRRINVALLDRETLRPGDWILIHAGFAMDTLDEATAQEQIAALREYTAGPDRD
jgi:hydrogenase expression/formation protein HypC